MDLIEFPEQTVVIAKNQPEYKPLPAYQRPGSPEGEIVCCWKLSWKERVKLLFTGLLWHSVWTFHAPLQPVNMTVDKPDMPPPAGPNASAQVVL